MGIARGRHWVGPSFDLRKGSYSLEIAGEDLTLPTTEIFMIVAVVLIAGFDVFAFARWGGNFTISTITWNVAQKYPIIPFAVGVLAGHLFWQMGCS